LLISCLLASLQAPCEVPVGKLVCLLEITLVYLTGLYFAQYMPSYLYACLTTNILAYFPSCFPGCLPLSIHVFLSAFLLEYPGFMSVHVYLSIPASSHTVYR